MSEPARPFMLAVRVSAEGVILVVAPSDGTPGQQILIGPDEALLLAGALRQAEATHRKLAAAPAVVGHA